MERRAKSFRLRGHYCGQWGKITNGNLDDVSLQCPGLAQPVSSTAASLIAPQNVSPGQGRSSASRLIPNKTRPLVLKDAAIVHQEFQLIHNHT